MAKEELIVVTEENMEGIFNENIYPTLAEAGSLKKMGKLIDDLLQKYTFEDEIMKVRFLIPVIDAVTKLTMESINLDFNEMDRGIKQQIGWNMVNTWFNNGAFMPMKLINYGDLLNHSSAPQFENIGLVDSETQEWLKKEATFIIDGVEKGDFKADEAQLKHLELINDGNLPFGLRKA